MDKIKIKSGHGQYYTDLLCTSRHLMSSEKLAASIVASMYGVHATTRPKGKLFIGLISIIESVYVKHYYKLPKSKNFKYIFIRLNVSNILQKFVNFFTVQKNRYLDVILSISSLVP